MTGSAVHFLVCLLVSLLSSFLLFYLFGLLSLSSGGCAFRGIAWLVWLVLACGFCRLAGALVSLSWSVTGCSGGVLAVQLRSVYRSSFVRCLLSSFGDVLFAGLCMRRGVACAVVGVALLPAVCDSVRFRCRCPVSRAVVRVVFGPGGGRVLSVLGCARA